MQEFIQGFSTPTLFFLVYCVTTDPKGCAMFLTSSFQVEQRYQVTDTRSHFRELLLLQGTVIYQEMRGTKRAQQTKRERGGAHPLPFIVFLVHISYVKQIFATVLGMCSEAFGALQGVGSLHISTEHKSQDRRRSWLSSVHFHLCSTLSSSHSFSVATVRMLEIKHFYAWYSTTGDYLVIILLAQH